MRRRKNVLLLFSKVPQPGLVKTRLTTLKDGIYEPEVASALYHNMLFDVCEICMGAFDRLEAREPERDAEGELIEDVYELRISTTPAGNLDAMRALFTASGEWPRPIAFDFDEGATFDDHYNQAFQKAWDDGADAILSMGADMPALTCADVMRGFDALHRVDALPRKEGAPAGGIVLAPDQEMGVSIVGWTRATAFDHSGVYYCQDGLTVLPAYIQKARRLGLPALYLPAVPDIDTMADLWHNVTLVEALNYTAPFDDNVPPWRTYDAFKQMGIGQIRVMPNDLRDPREQIDTPAD